MLAVDFYCAGHALSMEGEQHETHSGGEVCTAFVGWVSRSHEGEGPREAGQARDTTHASS